MKKSFAILTAAALILVLFLTPGCKNDSGVPLTGEVINVYNWGEYIADGSDGSMDINKEFTKRTGIKVNYTMYETNEVMYAKLKSGAADYDIIIPSDYMIEKLIAEDMLEKLDFSNIPNYKYIGEKFKGLLFDPENEYSVPYAWGVVGVFYNKDMVDEADVAAQSWDLMWNEKYKNQILMFENPKDAFGIALKKLGYSQDSENPDEYREAYELLREQKPLVQAYVMDQALTKIPNGDAAIAPYYAGEFPAMMEGTQDIGFYIPKEGTNWFVDSVCIVKGSKNKTAAEKYIDFLNDPEIAMENMDYVGYSTPNTAAFELMDEEVRNNPFFYPSDEVLARCDMFRNPPQEIYDLQDELWRKLMT